MLWGNKGRTTVCFKMADQIGVARRNIEANIKKLKERGILIRHGSPKNGYWEIVYGDRI